MKLFITGIGTNIGKTIVSAIITETLQADYWKPIQAGDLDHSDTQKVKDLISNSKTVFHPNSYALQTPASPHFAAELEGITIRIDKISEPKTQNHLVIEGAGGVLVPINKNETILDLIKDDYQVVIVSENYLGSINHTLLTVEVLQKYKKNILGIVFNGEPNPSTEKIILQKTGLPLLFTLDKEPYFDKNVIAEYVEKIHTNFINQ